MNIFWLDENLKKAAKYHCDKHVVKMILEYAQLLSTTVRLSGIDAGYKATHKNHPCAIWSRESLDNWFYLRALLFCLSDEYEYRYGKIHKSFLMAKDLPIPTIPSIGLTKPPLCMPDQYKVGNIVQSYRNYYIGDKQHIATWKKREKPEWYIKNEISS